MTKTGFSDVTKQILYGEFDDQIEELIEALVARRKIVRQMQAAQIRASLEPGDRVRIQNISPKYLIGTTAVVRSVPPRSKYVVVELEQAVGLYMARSTTKVPAVCLEKITK